MTGGVIDGKRGVTWLGQDSLNIWYVGTTVSDNIVGEALFTIGNRLHVFRQT